MYVLDEIVTLENYDEEAYLSANPDVANAVKDGRLTSGLMHFTIFGKQEGRRLRRPYSTISEAKKRKLERIKPILRNDMVYRHTHNSFDFLTEQLRYQFNIVDTDAVSSNYYDACLLYTSPSPRD